LSESFVALCVLCDLCVAFYNATAALKKFSITHEQMNRFGEILQQFADKIPVTVMVQCLLEGLLNPQKIDECLESVRGEQYTKKIFSSGPLIPKT
jgi:hypothetical protein